MVSTLEANHLKHVFGHKRFRITALKRFCQIRKSKLKP
uniref:Uncharacterized protein n=1 Tax=Vibrio tasmaniensis TaxID=212663 RepID=A0A0H3ZRT8_9VIBR|nr:hypothetical protein [Vibrio tasmaniensis]